VPLGTSALKEGAVVPVEKGTQQERKKKTNKRKHRAREKKTLQAQPSKEKKGDIPSGYS
jgi:hypothetical protein